MRDLIRRGSQSNSLPETTGENHARLVNSTGDKLELDAKAPADANRDEKDSLYCGAAVQLPHATLHRAWPRFGRGFNVDAIG